MATVAVLPRAAVLGAAVLGAAVLSAAVLSAACGPVMLSDSITVLRLPEGGRLPRAVIDDGGTVHAVYFEGDPSGGDLRYVTRAPGASAWSEPWYVNSQPGTVVGIGPIDGGQMALGRDGRLHVVWFKLGRTEFLYTRTNDAGTGFEPQFTLAGGEGVEAGPSVAADRSGSVYVFWHTGEPPDAERAVFMTASHDDGWTFSPARPVSRAAEGACDCCGLQALAGASGLSEGELYVSYRGAGDNVRRGQRLLMSGDGGETFADVELDPWEINACPISTTSLANGPDGVTVAWETRGQVYFKGDPRGGAGVFAGGRGRGAPQEPGGGRQRPPRDAARLGGRPGLAVRRHVPLAALRRRPGHPRAWDRPGDPGGELRGRRRRAERPLPRRLLTCSTSGIATGSQPLTRSPSSHSTQRA